MRGLFAVSVALAALSAGAFEKIALVDSFDFTGACGFDIETPSGTEKVLDHVLLTGADTVYWRNMSGALPRYPSAEESPLARESPLDLRRIPLNEPDRGWVRWYFPKTNLLMHAASAARLRGKGFGIHIPLEENHGEAWTYGAWNLEHPQFWCCRKGGSPSAGTASKTHPEVLAHKLRLVDEILFNGVKAVFVDTLRAGNWTVQSEGASVEEVRAAMTAYIRGIRARIDASGKDVRLVLGVPRFSFAKAGDYTLDSRGVDWRKLAAEGTVDGLAVMSVMPRGGRDIFEETRALYHEFMCHRGKAKVVYFPVAAYGWNFGIPQYCSATGLSREQVTQRLLELADEAGGDGVTLECVDFGNYSKGMCEVIRNFKPKAAAGR